MLHFSNSKTKPLNSEYDYVMATVNLQNCKSTKNATSIAEQARMVATVTILS